MEGAVADNSTPESRRSQNRRAITRHKVEERMLKTLPSQDMRSRILGASLQPSSGRGATLTTLPSEDRRSGIRMRDHYDHENMGGAQRGASDLPSDRERCGLRRAAFPGLDDVL